MSLFEQTHLRAPFVYKTSSKPVPPAAPGSSAEVGKWNSGVSMKSMKLTVNRFLSDLSSRKDWMLSSCQKLFLLCSCHLTSFHSSDDIMVQQLRLGDYGTAIQICHRYFLWALSSHCADTLYPNKIRKRSRFLCFSHQCFILRHGPGCSLSSSLV